MACDSENHRYYVAETVGVPAEGTVTVVAVCTNCGDFISERFVVAKGATPLVLRSEAKQQTKK